jgi:hypothetical protein
MVGFTKSAGIVPHRGREEAERRHQLIAQGSLPAPGPATPSCWPPSGSTWTRSWPASRRAPAGRPNVEAQGLTPDQLRTALLEELDQGR